MNGSSYIGTEIGGCLIEEEIGRGGMGVVFRATQLRLGRRVALKLIAPELARDEGFRRRFERESRVAASIDHPHVVPLYEAGEEHGQLFLTMRYVEGTDLDEVIAAGRGLEPARAARIVQQVSSALDAVHRQGLVHRDVKPANVLLSGEGVDEHAYLSDFGLTKEAASKSALTHTGHWVGTADYVAPEQLEGKPIDARTDVYALGCLLYQALTGSVPFPGTELTKMWGHVNSPPPAPSAGDPGSPAFDAVVARSMAKDPEERFPSAGDLGRAAEAAARGERVAQPERSVATGAAAPLATPPAASGGATRLEHAPAPTPRPAPAGAAPLREPVTDPLPPAPRRTGIAVAVVLSAVVAAMAGVAIALILQRDDPPTEEARTASERFTRERRPRSTSRTVTETVPPPTPSGAEAAPDGAQADSAPNGAEANLAPVGAARFSTPRSPGQTYRAAYCRIDESGPQLRCWTPNDGYTLAMPGAGPGARDRSAQAQNKGLAPSGYTELGFGEESTEAGFTCASRSSGLTCTNSAGYGWNLPRYRGLPTFFEP